MCDTFDTTFQMETVPFQTIGTLAGLTVVTAKSFSTNQTLALCPAGQWQCMVQQCLLGPAKHLIYPPPLTRDILYLSRVYILQIACSKLIVKFANFSITHFIDCFFSRADTTVSYDGKKYNVFRCIEWTKITNNSFYYYIQQGN